MSRFFSVSSLIARRGVWAWLAVALSTGAILLATLHQAGNTVANSWTWSLTTGEAALAELIQNLLLFIPLGISLTLAFPLSRRACPERSEGDLLRIVAIGALLSFSVEFTQQWIPGRDPSVGDIVCNTISTALGVGLVQLAPRWLTVPAERSGWHALGAAVLAVAVWLGTAAVLRPTFPPPPHYVIPAPDWNFWGHYRGQILEAALRQRMLYVKAVAPPRPPGRVSPLAAILDAHGTPATVLAVDGRDLSMRYHMPALALRFDQPDLRWEGALANIAPGDTFTAMTGRDVGHLCLALNTDWRCNLGYTIGDGWRLIYFSEGWPRWFLALINACWVAGWTIGVGWWAARGGEGRQRAAKVAVAIVLLGMIVVPMLTHLKGTSLVEWIGGLVGIELGLVLGSLPSSAAPRRPSPPSVTEPESRGRPAR